MMDNPYLEEQRLKALRSPEQIDAENLDTLTLCHYIAGGLIALFSCMFIGHIVLGLTMVHSPNMFTAPAVPPGGSYPAGQTYPPVQFFPFQGPQMGYFITAMGTIAVLGGWIIGGLTIYAGRCLKARKNYLFILIMAGVNAALVMPLGTALGVFTFLILFRPTVKPLFNA